MSAAQTPPKQVKMEGQQCTSSGAITVRKPEKASQIEVAKAKRSLETDFETKKRVKHENDPDPTTSSTASVVTNPLSGRSGSVNVKQEVGEQVQATKGPSRNCNKPGTLKAPRQRKKPTVNTFDELTKHFHTRLDKDDGVVVDCMYLAQDNKAVVDEKSQEWVHVLKLRSELPFCLIKQTILQTGLYANHLAILIRQETPFRILDLPLHIRTQIYKFALKDHEPICIAMKSGSRTVYAPSYHGPNILALLRTCKQIHTEAAPVVYTQAFQFPGTQVLCNFLLKISRNRALVRSLRSETYASHSARTMFHLLAEAPNLSKLSFAHVSSSETPKKAVNNIWNDAGVWLVAIDRNNPTKGLDILEFNDKAFHMRERNKKAGEVKITCWGPNEQLEFLRGLQAKMVTEGKRLNKVD